jgi:hypothetical protein
MSRLALSVALVTVLAGCGGTAESSEDMESEATGAAVRATTVRATPVAPVRAIPAGTLLTFEVRENVSTGSHVSGDGFSLVLVDAVTGSAEAFLPAGTAARGTVTESHKSTGPQDPALLAVRIASVQSGGSQREIQGEVQSAEIESSTQDSGSRTAATIAVGTAAGAIIGQILGRDTRGTVTGAAVGTAIGVGVALTSRDGDARLPVGSRIVVRLDRELVL